MLDAVPDRKPRRGFNAFTGTVTRTIWVIAILRLLSVSAQLPAQAPASDSLPQERQTARAWFRNARFGMFIHWGVYSQLGQGEWVMQNRGITVDSYEWLASNFNPTRVEAREWVSLAKRAGVRYVTITSRHHDGFS